MDRTSELNKIWHLLNQLMQDELNKEQYAHIRELSTTEISVLQLLHNRPTIILKEICTVLNIPKSTLTSAVNRLVGKGCVKRVTAENDKRAFTLHITKLGVAVQKEHLALEHSVLSRLLNHLSKDEAEALLCLLKKAMGGTELG